VRGDPTTCIRKRRREPSRPGPAALELGLRVMRRRRYDTTSCGDVSAMPLNRLSGQYGTRIIRDRARVPRNQPFGEAAMLRPRRVGGRGQAGGENERAEGREHAQAASTASMTPRR
jgi:hypothetical protein